MSTINSSVGLFLNLNTAQIIITKRFDSRLGSHGINLNIFLILYHLKESPDERLRRTDLAEKTGLTASGITRMLLPIEKMGLIKKEADSRDSRISYVKLSASGKRIFNEANETATIVADQILTDIKAKRVENLSKVLVQLAGRIS